MSRDEFQAWAEYFSRYPFDDHHRYHRPAALIGASMGGNYEAKLEMLSPGLRPIETKGRTAADRKTIEAMRALGIPQKRNGET